MSTPNPTTPPSAPSAPKEPEVKKEEPVIPVDKHVRNAIVLKTVQDNLNKVANSFQAQQAREGADPKMVELLETAKAQLDAIQD